MKLFLLMSLLTVSLHTKETRINHKGKPVMVMGACTAVFVAPDTLLTANHCISTSIGQQWAKLADGKVYTAVIVGTDPKEDVALLHFNGPQHVYARLGHPVTPTSHVFTVNSGEDYQNTYGEGVVENIVSIDEITSPGILHNIAIFPGASGSGLFDGKGHLVGINVMKEGGLSWAVNTSTIKKFLNNNGIKTN